MLSPAEYGAAPNDAADDTAALRAAVAAAAERDGATLRLEAGIYRLSGDAATNGPLFRVKNAKGLRIDGNGAVFLISTPTIGLFHFDSVTDLEVRDFTVRYDPVPFAWGTIIESRMNEGGFLLEPAPESPPFDTDWVRRNGQWGYFLNPEVSGRLMAGAPNVVFLREPPVVTDRGPVLIRLDGPSSRIGMVSVGNRFVLNVRDNRSPIIFVAASEGVRLENLVIEQSVGGHFLAVDSEEVSVLGCAARIAPGLPKSGNADFIHFQNCRGPIRIEGNQVAGISDDGVNLYSKPFFLLEKENDRVIRLSKIPERPDPRRAAGRIREGDRLYVFDREVGQVVLRTTVTATEPDCGKVGLADDLPSEVRVGERWSFYIAEYARDVTVTDNVFENSRRFGVFLKGYDVTIQGNRFEGLSGAGLFLSNEPDNYREGLFTENVRIVDNRFIDCGFSSNFESNPSWAAITIQALRLGHQPAPLIDAHRKIQIEDNIFSGNGRKMRVKNVNEFSVDGN